MSTGDGDGEAAAAAQAAPAPDAVEPKEALGEGAPGGSVAEGGGAAADTEAYGATPAAAVGGSGGAYNGAAEGEYPAAASGAGAAYVYDDGAGAATGGEWIEGGGGGGGGGGDDDGGAAVADPNLTYHLSSPGGEAPTSEATHTLLSVNDEVPNFAGFSQLGRIEFHDYIAGGWSVLVTFARSFDPVSMTELGRIAKLMKNFEARSVNVLGIVQDSVLMLSNFLTDVATIEQCKVNFPVVADPDGAIARRLGVWDRAAAGSASGSAGSGSGDGGIARSCTFVMDPFKKVQFRLATQQDVGRSFYEVLRVIDALSVHAEAGCAAPANWTYGEEVLVSPWVQEAEYPRLYPKGVAKITKYYRSTPYPLEDE